MEPKKLCKKINDVKERLRIVLASLVPGVNKSALCRQEGIYIQQLIRWTREALEGAQERLKPQPRGKKNDPEKECLKQEIDALKDIIFEQTKENIILKKKTNTL